MFPVPTLCTGYMSVTKVLGLRYILKRRYNVFLTDTRLFCRACFFYFLDFEKITVSYDYQYCSTCNGN